MICSHSRRFVFIKTIKTAGTSLEMALEPLCGPEDVVTPIWSDGEVLPEGAVERDGRNYRRRWSELRPRDLITLLHRRRMPVRFGNHMSAADARRELGEDVWRRYFTFTIVRNPFDRAVSHYFWSTRGLPEDRRPPLGDWIEAHRAAVAATWRLCAEGDELLVDDVARYERLAEDLPRIAARIGYDGDLHADMRRLARKTGQRPARADHRSLIDARAQALIEEICAPEIARFDYAF